MIECRLHFLQSDHLLLIASLRARDPDAMKLPRTDPVDVKAYFLFLRHLPSFFVFIAFPSSAHDSREDGFEINWL